VNGELFSGSVDTPRFSKIARSYLLHIGSLDWTKINPDIFGSMIQAVAEDEERGALGMQYTSVPNILKVLDPLFLDDLRARLEEADDNPRKLVNLRSRMAKIRVFDPACGSGNFLVIAYKAMREIEAEINRRRGEADRRSAFRAYRDEPWAVEWRQRYAAHVELVKSANEAQWLDPAFQRRLWDENPISNIGPGTSVTVEGAYSDATIARELLQFRDEPLASDLAERGKRLQDKFDHVLARVYPAHAKRRPKARLVRLMAAMFPRDMTCLMDAPRVPLASWQHEPPCAVSRRDRPRGRNPEMQRSDRRPPPVGSRSVADRAGADRLR
jgi:hypothetical protein